MPRPAKDTSAALRQAVGPASASAEEVEAWERDHVLHPWAAQPPVSTPIVVRARGTRFWGADGSSYLDFTSQLVFANLGHSDPRLAEAASEQMRTVPAVASSFGTEPKARLARLLAEITPGDLSRTMFTTSGTEANEAALKITRIATGRDTIVNRYRSYHGSSPGVCSGDQRPEGLAHRGGSQHGNRARPLLLPVSFRADPIPAVTCGVPIMSGRSFAGTEPLTT